MENFQISFFAILTFVGAPNSELCKTPQYIEHSTSAIIKCFFKENAFAILWYNSTDFLDEPILYFKEGVKSGIGFTSGEFDVLEDGSLVIHNVSLKHDHYFTAVKLDSPNDDFIPHQVLAIVTVTPSVKFPHISGCAIGRGVCYKETSAEETINCAIHDSRPAIPLEWVARTAYGDMDITSHTEIPSRGVMFSTVTSVNNLFNRNPDLMLLVCRKVLNSTFVDFRESVILIRNKHQESLLPSFAIVFVQHNTEGKLTCSGWNSTFLVWKMKIRDSGIEIPLAIFVATENITESLFEGYDVDNGGSLIIPLFELHHEGTYNCLYGNGFEAGFQRYQVISYVLPTPKYPAVDGCLHQDYCVLEKQSKGELTCRLLGVRPEAHLEWHAFPRSKSSKITFYDYSKEISEKGDLFDISIKTKYRLIDVSENRITVECKGSIGNGSLLNFSTKLDLFFVDASSNVQTDSIGTFEATVTYTQMRWIIPIAIVTAFLLLALVVFANVRRAGRCNRQTGENLRCEEALPMMTENPKLSEAKHSFIKEIKAKYEEICAAVYPVPFIRNKMLTIHNVFVEGGIEFLNNLDNRLEREHWNRLNSYTDIFTDKRVKAKRYILQAPAGYGKSTLCLQLLHDWYSKERTSSIKDFEVLIFLRLRQIGSDMSICQAVRHLLLPQDSHLSVEEVRLILASCKSVLIVLDGYDEYNYTADESETEITKIMKRDIFQSFDVVLTTRTYCMPQVGLFAPKTKKLRLLGFDKNARDLYISKAVVNNKNKDAQLLRDRLEENPILKDLCQVPLFFAMFAHLTHEKETFKHFISVTSFFRYVLSCILAHTKNKFSKKCFHQDVHDHCELDKAAFDSLAKIHGNDVWVKETLIGKIGKDCFDKYVSIGILTIEKVCTIVDKPGVTEHEHIRYIENVRFCHDIFREWYAGHHVSKIAPQASMEDLNVQLKHHNPFNLQYVFRFACGLDTNAGQKIIRYLKQISISDEIIILCVIENSGNCTNIIDTVKDLCSRAIELRKSDSKMMQRATAQLLDIAFQNKVTISCLRLWNCFEDMCETARNYQMDIRTLCPNLRGISRVEIYENDIMLTSSVVETILTYVSTCKEVETVAFFDCVMPISFQTSRNMEFEVTWYAITGEWYTFDRTSSQWKITVESENGLKHESNLPVSKYEEMIHFIENDGEIQ